MKKKLPAKAIKAYDSSARFLIGLFICLVLSFTSSLYSLEIKPLSELPFVTAWDLDRKMDIFAFKTGKGGL